ncbi:hypothetical protein DGMP_34990 [Desulfomarina profundi]|uniref:Uncharacterized protein n=1 Tax=Desulfomarina profundi TaxID=2772557 RepID=A0A8D5FLJ9_9BACT|nr:hypothetical protein DGMP_34990 [Desulfomarina profundi]
MEKGYLITHETQPGFYEPGEMRVIRCIFNPNVFHGSSEEDITDSVYGQPVMNNKYITKIFEGDTAEIHLMKYSSSRQ